MEILKGRWAYIEFTPVFGLVLVTLFVRVLATVLVTVFVTVAEYYDLNMKNFEFFDFFRVLVFDDELTVPFLELINDSFCC